MDGVIISRSIEVSVLICHDFKPWRDNLKIIENSIRNLNLFISTSKHCEFIICLDYLRPEYNSNEKVRSKFKKFIKVLNSKGLNTVVLEEWGHLSSVLTKALQCVDSKYLFICQADLLFVKEIQLDNILEFIRESNVCVRFNRRANNVAGMDLKLFPVEFKGLNFLKTNNWSDNNHVCLTSYYSSQIIPLIQNVKEFPEDVIRRLDVNKSLKLNSFIFGYLGEEKYIEHFGESDRFAHKIFKKSRSIFFAKLSFYLNNFVNYFIR